MDIAAVLRTAQEVDPAAVLDLVSTAAREFGATDFVAYLVDFEQKVLEPLPNRAAHPDLPQSEEVATTMAGRAFLTQAPVTADREAGVRVWVPLVEGSDRTGVLALTLPQVDESVLNECMDLAVVAGYLIAVHTRSTDVYQLHRRRKAMSLEASMQWDLLPPLVLRSPSCSVAGRLEPAYDVGGDCFDYAINGSVLDVALIDAMGHGLTSSTIASLVIGCYRHDRREGRSLAYIHTQIDAVLERQFDGVAFATGQMAQIELESGLMTMINAGHPRPLLIRQGQVIRQIVAEPTLPWGLNAGPAELAQEALEPGDSVLFFTDGVIEARTPEGVEFGVERLVDVTGQHASEELSPEEMVRQIVRSVLDHRVTQLRDDATVLLVQWHGSQSQGISASAAKAVASRSSRKK